MTADVSMTNASFTPFEPVDPNDSTTASIMSLKGMSADPGPDLTLCATIWSGLASNTTNAAMAQGLSSQDGSGCGKFLSEECMHGIVNFTETYAMDCRPTAPIDLAIPPSCGAQFSTDYFGIGPGSR